MKKLKDKFLKIIKMVLITLKEFIDWFQQDSKASILTAIEKKKYLL